MILAEFATSYIWRCCRLYWTEEDVIPWILPSSICHLYGSRWPESTDVQSWGAEDWIPFCISTVHQQHWGSSAEKRKGGWFRSITPQIMWYSGSGCATMATVFHWPTDGLPSVSVWYLLNGGLGVQRASSTSWWMLWGEADRGNERCSDERRPGVRITF